MVYARIYDIIVIGSTPGSPVQAFYSGVSWPENGQPVNFGGGHADPEVTVEFGDAEIDIRRKVIDHAVAYFGVARRDIILL